MGDKEVEYTVAMSQYVSSANAPPIPTEFVPFRWNHYEDPPVTCLCRDLYFSLC